MKINDNDIFLAFITLLIGNIILLICRRSLIILNEQYNRAYLKNIIRIIFFMVLFLLFFSLILIPFAFSFN